MRQKKRDQDGIYRRPDSPCWWASCPDGRGGSTRRSTGVRWDADPAGLKAKAVRAGWLAAELAPPRVEGHTFDELLVAYLGSVSPKKRDPSRDKVSAKALYPHFTGRSLTSIQGVDVRGYIAARLADGVVNGTVNKEIGLMSAALNWARRELEWTEPNPWESRRLPEPPGRGRWLSRAEADALLDAAHRRAARYPWIEDFIRLGLNTGMRSGEMLGLAWDRVDLTGRRVELREGDQKSGRRGWVPLNETARGALIDRARFRATWCPGSLWVFCRRDGTRVQSIKKGFAGCVADAGLEDVHPHDLRRTFGSWLVQSGVGIERVSELLRHGDVAITARVYAHLRPSDLAEAAKVLDQRKEVPKSEQTNERRK